MAWNEGHSISGFNTMLVTLSQAAKFVAEALGPTDSIVAIDEGVNCFTLSFSIVDVIDHWL